MALYSDYATSEQFHSEFKNDLLRWMGLDSPARMRRCATRPNVVA